MSTTVDIVFVAHPAVMGFFLLAMGGFLVYSVIRFVASVVTG